MGSGPRFCTPESSSSELADTHALPTSNSPLLLWVGLLDNQGTSSLKAGRCGSTVSVLRLGIETGCPCLSQTSAEVSGAGLNKDIQRVWQGSEL